MPKAKGMEAVAEKVGRKQPVFAKKGAMKGARKPGVAIMIALGSPKKGPPPRPMEEEDEEDEEDDYDLNASSQTDEIARLKARIAELEAKLAEYEGEEMGEEEEGEEMDEEMED